MLLIRSFRKVRWSCWPFSGKAYHTRHF